MKTKNRNDIEDRAQAYRDWRWEQGFGGATDVDLVEWDMKCDPPRPLGIFELTRQDILPNQPNLPPDTYLQKIVDRFGEQKQGQVARLIAAALGVKVWIVVFREKMDLFWVYNWSDNRGWWKMMSTETYRHWLTRLK